MKPDKTFVCGCLIDAMQPLFLETLDALADSDIKAATVSRIGPTRDGSRSWGGYPLEGWDPASACYSAAFDLRCLLNTEGLVNLYGPLGNPDHTFQIQDAGVFRQGSKGLGYVSHIRAIGTGLYVCGDCRQVYRFAWNGKDLASGSWQDMAGPMREAPVSDQPPEDGDAFDMWLDAQDRCNFEDIDGSSDSDIYAVGDEAWHFDGQGWQRLTLPTDETLHALLVVDAQRVLMVGHNGTLLMGNARQGFKDLSGVDDNQNFTGVAVLGDRIWLASNMGLFVYDDAAHGIQPYATDLKVDLVDTHMLEAKDGVLWSFGFKDLAYLDTRQDRQRWVRVYHPDNPRVDLSPPARKARRQPPSKPIAQSAGVPDLSWLPPQPRQGIDIAQVMRRVGYCGIASDLLDLLKSTGLSREQLLQEISQTYEVPLRQHGLVLMLQWHTHPSFKGDTAWGLAGVSLHARGPQAWRGPWPLGIEPDKLDWLARVQQSMGEADAEGQGEYTFFTGDGKAAWALCLTTDMRTSLLGHVRLRHMGACQLWPGQA